MSLFQCENCGGVENTACSFQGFSMMDDCFDWTGLEDLRGKKICSACGPSRFSDGEDSGFGKLWEWTQQQEWIEVFFDYYRDSQIIIAANQKVIYEHWYMEFIHPGRFANAVYEFLKGRQSCE